MKNIFVLTKAEQRAVIVIVMALLAATIAKRFLEHRTRVPRSITNPAQPTAAPSLPEEERSAPEERP
jgi:hypothetical protein